MEHLGGKDSLPSSLSSKTAWFMYQVPDRSELYHETLSHNNDNDTTDGDDDEVK